MAATALVERDLSDGRALLRSLDEANFPVFAALWLLNPDSGNWTLHMGSSVVDEVGGRAAYARLQGILNSTKSRLTLRRVTLVGTHDRFLSQIVGAGTIEETDENPDVRIQDTMLNGVFVEEAVIYRLQPSPATPTRTA
jgi:hypothetical protein